MSTKGIRRCGNGVIRRDISFLGCGLQDGNNVTLRNVLRGDTTGTQSPTPDRLMHNDED